MKAKLHNNSQILENNDKMIVKLENGKQKQKQQQDQLFLVKAELEMLKQNMKNNISESEDYNALKTKYIESESKNK